MVANRVRDIALLGERRHRDERYPESELIKTGALVRKRTRWIRRKRCAEGLFNVEADRALRASTSLLAGRRIGSIGTTSRYDAIRCALPSLPRPRWSNVIVRAAMLVVSNKDDRILPERPIAHCIYHLRDKRLSSLDIGRRMFIVLELDAKQTKVRINKRNRRQIADARRPRSL